MDQSKNRTNFILQYVLTMATVKPNNIHIKFILNDAQKAWDFANKEQGDKND